MRCVKRIACSGAPFCLPQLDTLLSPTHTSIRGTQEGFGSRRSHCGADSGKCLNPGRNLSTFCASSFPSFFPLPTSPSFLNPSPSSDLKTPSFPSGNLIFRGWGTARVLEGVNPQKKEGISLKHGARKLVRNCISPSRKIEEGIVQETQRGREMHGS